MTVRRKSQLVVAAGDMLAGGGARRVESGV